MLAQRNAEVQRTLNKVRLSNTLYNDDDRTKFEAPAIAVIGKVVNFRLGIDFFQIICPYQKSP